MTAALLCHTRPASNERSFSPRAAQQLHPRAELYHSCSTGLLRMRRTKSCPKSPEKLVIARSKLQQWPHATAVVSCTQLSTFSAFQVGLDVDSTFRYAQMWKMPWVVFTKQLYCRDCSKYCIHIDGHPQRWIKPPDSGWL